MSLEPGILAQGTWGLDRVEAHWREDPYRPDPDTTAAADAAIDALRDRGSPAHDGLGGRLVGLAATPAALALEIEPARWALRLNPADAGMSIAALCVTRAADGRWLAGRRSAWTATWPGRWALGAGGAVDSGENPAQTLVRELEEEWAVAPAEIAVRALVCLPHRLVMFVGLAWLPAGAEVEPDAEHDAHAWWPASVDDWPGEADAALRGMARLLDA